MDASTLLIVFLLVSAASLASYALSHWRSTRGAGGSLGWAATGLGTTMLLIAAAIVVLTFVFRGALWPLRFGAEQEARRPAAATNKVSTRAVPTAEVPAAAASKSAPPLTPAAQPTAHRDGSEVRALLTPAGNQHTSTPGSQQSAGQHKSASSSASLPVFADDDPWAATGCVYVFNPDLGEPTRWKIENGCNVPVGIIVSFCTENSPGCTERTTSWKYPSRGLLFPAAPQRPVTHDEQTLYAQAVRYVACYVSTPSVVWLIGAPSEERSSASWREQFESARMDDGCLARVQSWSAEGQRTRLPIDILLGLNSQLTNRSATSEPH